MSALRVRAGAEEVELDPSATFLYAALHLGCLGVLWTGVTQSALMIFAGSYLFRIFGSSVAFHRYFAHRSFKTSRPMQFLLGLYGCLTVPGGPLWWAQTHRVHHKHADTPDDLHSPRHHGFLYAHAGWFLNRAHRNTDLAQIPDLARFPELVLLDRFSAPITLSYGVLMLVWFGLEGLVWGFVLPSVLILQMTHWVQSVSHSLGGYRHFDSPDDSRNHWLFGVLSMGEGFHHNHHRFASSARSGLEWWEIDVSYWLIKLMAWVGLVWDVREPSRARIEGALAKVREARATGFADRSSGPAVEEPRA